MRVTPPTHERSSSSSTAVAQQQQPQQLSISSLSPPHKSPAPRLIRPGIRPHHHHHHHQQQQQQPPSASDAYSRTDEVVLVTSFAAFIVAYNAIAGGLTDFDLVKHGAIIPHLPLLGLPLSFFTLTGSSLGLLLVFRTNAAYARWDDARKQWGSIINNCRSLVRQANTFFKEDRYPGYGNFRDYRRRVAAETSAFTRCLRCFLRGKSDEPNLQVELAPSDPDPDPNPESEPKPEPISQTHWPDFDLSPITRPVTPI